MRTPTPQPKKRKSRRKEREESSEDDETSEEEEWIPSDKDSGIPTLLPYQSSSHTNKKMTYFHISYKLHSPLSLEFMGI